MKIFLLIFSFIVFGNSMSGQTYSIFGNVYNDPDAGNINASASPFSLPFEKIVVALVKTNGDTISHTASVNSLDGSFVINSVPSGTYYAVLITPNVNLLRGAPSPALVLETGWSRTGEALGGTGIPDSLKDGKTQTITVAGSNVTGVMFGIQERPFSNNKMNILLDNTASSPTSLVVNGSSEFTQGNTDILEGYDNSSGYITSYSINLLPKYGRLYLGGTPVTLLSQVTTMTPAQFATLAYLPGTAALEQEIDFFTYYVTDNAFVNSDASTYVIPFPLLESDKDTYANRNDLDDDNDGITDVEECGLNVFSNLVAAYYANEFTFLRPSNFGLSVAHRTGLNLSADLSALYGKPAGSVIVTINNANTHPTANEFYVNDSAGASQWTVTGTLSSYTIVEHGLQYFSYDTRTITLLNATPKYYLMSQQAIDPPQNNWWKSGNDNYSWWIKSDTALRVTTAAPPVHNPRLAALSIALTDPEPKYFQIASTANNRDEWSTYFVRILPECDYDNDGVPNRLDLDSDNDGCLDALEGSAGYSYSDISNAGGTVWIGPGSLSPVNRNLCASVTCVDTNGIPLIAAGGQSPASAYNENTISMACTSLLPIELSVFEVENRQNNACLSWTTLSEQNNKGFGIYRSIDGITWEIIAFVTGGGTSGIPLHYSYTDIVSDAEGDYYYRLRQIDYDGQFELLPIRSVSFENKNNPAVRWYPNPGKGAIRFETSSSQNLKLIVVSDALGSPVLSLDAANLTGNYLNIDFLPSGTYFISFVKGADIQTDKLIIQQ